MTPELRAALERLIELDKKATPGPWDADDAKGDGNDYYQIDAPTPKGLNPNFPYTVLDTLNRHHCISPDEDRANATLAAHARNHAAQAARYALVVPVLVEALVAVKLRAIFVNWPAESLWDCGDGVMIPDWRKEFAIIEAALDAARKAGA